MFELKPSSGSREESELLVLPCICMLSCEVKVHCPRHVPSVSDSCYVILAFIASAMTPFLQADVIRMIWVSTALGP